VARRKTAIEEETEINITPMLDVVFIMLIFFIVTTSFVRETGIDPNRPEAWTATTKERANILIAVSSVNDIWMNKGRIEMEQVRALVEAALAESPESSVVIIVDEDAATGNLIDLMDQVRLAGVSNISLAAEKR